MKNKVKFRDRMIFKLTMISLISLLISFALFIVFIIFLDESGKWQIEVPDEPKKPFFFAHNFLFVGGVLVCLFSSLMFSIYMNKKFLKPIEELKERTNEVSKGDFSVRIDYIPNNEIGELAKNFNAMVEELQKNEMLKNDFITNVSHEFKTPLSIIQGYATLLQDPDLNKEDREKYTETIVESTSKLTTLVNNILKISKLDNQKITIENTYYYLDEQIRESILSFENEWTNKKIDLDCVAINADKNLLINVWNNLLSNAIKYSNEGGKIEIKLCKEGNSINVKIKDDGCGMKKEDIPYIFDKFYQCDKSHISEGNGLGLSLVKKIVEISNGDIKVASELGIGTEFTIILPVNI